MAFGASPVDVNGIPISSVYVPSTGFRALQGTEITTDGSSNDSAAAVIAPVTVSAAALTNVAASATTVSILASNTARIAVYLYNDSSSAMYLAYAATASTSAYTVKIPANNLWEMPATPMYTGALSALWDSATGNARITQLS